MTRSWPHCCTANTAKPHNQQKGRPLSLTFAQRQHIRHARSEHLKAHLADEERCVGCGADLDSQTRGCKPCWQRHHRRRTRTRKPTSCVACGGPIEGETPGCRRCYKRHWFREYRARRAA